MFNIAPTDEVLVAVQDEAAKVVREMRWWLTPSWAPGISSKFTMFNARAETIETSRAFNGPFRNRRAIIPASGYIEWSAIDGIKQPFYIHPNSSYCFFAGLWDRWERDGNLLESCTIITTEASPLMTVMHPRQPLFITPDQFDLWLDATANLNDIRPLLAPVELEGWIYYPMSKKVGNAENKSGSLMKSVGEIKKLEG